MSVSLLLLLKFGYDIVKRLINDAYFRSLGILVLIMAGVGTLFFWLVEGRTFLKALAYSVATLSMNSPYGLGPATTGGIVFNIFYVFLGVGLFIIFVLEVGKTMVRSYEEFTRKLAERRALKRAKRKATGEGQGNIQGTQITISDGKRGFAWRPWARVAPRAERGNDEEEHTLDRSESTNDDRGKNDFQHFPNYSSAVVTQMRSVS